MSDQSIEQEIQAKGKTAPRVTPDDVEANIVGEFYMLPTPYNLGCGYCIGAFDSEKIYRHTICILTLRNGFTVVGINEGPVSADNFDAEIGRHLARQNAVQKIWPLMGYALKERLSQTE